MGGVPLQTLVDAHEGHFQAAKKQEKDPDGGSFPAYPSGKTWDEPSGKTGSGKKFFHNIIPGSAVKSEIFYVAIITPVIHYCMGGLQTTVDGECIKRGRPCLACMLLGRLLAACMATIAWEGTRSWIALSLAAWLAVRRRSTCLVQMASSGCIRLTPRTSRSQKSPFSEWLLFLSDAPKLCRLGGRIVTSGTTRLFQTT